jgi:hypothetical protein
MISAFPWRWYRQSILKWFFVESMSVPFSSFPWILASPESGQRIHQSGTPSLLKKSLSISKYLYPFKRVYTSIRRNLFTKDDGNFTVEVSIYQFCRKQLTKLANLLMHSQCALSEPISSSRKMRTLTVCRFI